jgi:Putative Ig domain
MSYVPWVYTPESAPPPSPLVVLTSALPEGYQGVAYAATLTAAGGTEPYTWSVVVGSLPAWANLNATTGQITGTPTATGTATITVRVTDDLSDTADAGTLTLAIVAAPTAITITTTGLPSATRDVPYTVALGVVGGTPPYSWTLVAPNDVLPLGLALDGATGVISGRPTTAGSVAIRALVTDDVAGYDDSGLLTLTVAPVPALTITTPATLPPGEANTAYSRTFAVTGGYGAKTWTKVSGSYPAGTPAFALTGAGVLTGTPTAVGDATFRLQVTDADATVATKDFVLAVLAEGAAEGPHDYFAELLALPEIAGGANVGSWTLRDATSLDALLTTWPNSVWSYVFGADDYADGQDAARFVSPHSLISGNQLIAQIPGSPTTGRLLITLDSFYGAEMYASLAPATLLNWKCHQVQAERPSGPALYIEPRIRFARDLGASYIGVRDLRTYAMDGNDRNAGPYHDFGIVAGTPYEPTGPGAEVAESFVQRHSVWCRDWYDLLLNQPGTAFTDWNAAYSPSTPIGTANIVSAVVDGADTLITMDAGEVLVGIAAPETTSWWIDMYTSPPSCRITIAGSATSALNGEWDVLVEGTEQLRIVGTALSAGASGTASKHFTMWTWWHMEEGGNLTRIYYRVPIPRNYTGALRTFRVEYNTSKGIEELQGFFITAPPTQATPTVVTTEAHDLVSGERVWIANSDVIPEGAYVVTVINSTQISVPVTVSAASVMHPETRPAIQRINLADATTGDTFTLSFSGTLTPTITHTGGDMTTRLREGLAAAASPLRTATVAAAGGALYDITITTTKTSLIQVTSPVGFTPGATTAIQTPIGGGYYAGTYGRVVKPLRGYNRNLAMLTDFTPPDVDDPTYTTFFRAPVR